MPVPGFLAATISREISAPAGISRVRDDRLLEHLLHLAVRLEVVLVHGVREHRLELADAVDEVLELERLGREARVGAVEVTRKREVLLDDRRPERHRRERRVVPERVVGEADRLPVALAQLREHVQADALGGCRVLRRALQHRHLIAGRGDSSVELFPRGHPRGQEHRLAGRGRRAHELQVRDLARADLVARDADALEALDGAGRERGAEELDAGGLARRFQRSPLLVRECRPLEVLPAGLVLEVRRRGCVPGGLGLRVVQLELDRVDAALGSDLRHPDRVAEAPVVGHPDLGDDVDRAHRGDASFAS